MSDGDVKLRRFAPEDAPWIARRHGVLYRASDGFDDTFEPLVASILAAFVKDHDPERERGWVAQKGTQTLGTIFCVDQGDNVAKLRLFYLEPEARGQGIGSQLLCTCVNFAQDAGYSEMQLWTHESHKAACALYAKSGFRLVSAKPVHSFGQDLMEQAWARDLKTRL